MRVSCQILLFLCRQKEESGSHWVTRNRETTKKNLVCDWQWEGEEFVLFHASAFRLLRWCVIYWGSFSRTLGPLWGNDCVGLGHHTRRRNIINGSYFKILQPSYPFPGLFQFIVLPWLHGRVLGSFNGYGGFDISANLFFIVLSVHCYSIAASSLVVFFRRSAATI